MKIEIKYAEQQELILEEIYLNGDNNEEYPINVYADKNSGLIYTVCNKRNTLKSWELTDEQNKIAKEHREEILDYCLCIVTPQDEVSLSDIFLHGKYVKKLGYIN